MTAVLDNGLIDVIERLVGEPIDLIGARSHPMQSSCALTEISLRDHAGERRELLLKDLSSRSRHPAPWFLLRQEREIEVYQLLHDRGLDLPCCVGVELDPGRDRYSLLIERVEGIPLWQSGDPLDWRRAANWLVDLHELSPLSAGPAWLRYDGDYYARWLERALVLAPDAGLAALNRTHDAAIAHLARADAVIVHGDYYPSNVIVCPERARGICPLDFELAGVGPAVLDLAALVTGLPKSLVCDVVDTYLQRRNPPVSLGAFEELLLCARLHLAIRWLGWMPDWHPPTHQIFDWVAEAHAVAAALEERG